MEDSHLMELQENSAFLGVFDGHGGKEVAIYAGKHFVDVLRTVP
jgi:protein phosphatase 1G